MMGTGEASGEGRAIEAAQKAIANPLLDEVSMRGAKGVIINITGGDDLKLMEVDEAASYIRDMVDGDANIMVGSAFNPELEGMMRVSVVATGIDAAAKPMPMTVPTKKATGSAFLSQPNIFSTPAPAPGMAGQSAVAEPTPVAEPIAAPAVDMTPPEAVIAPDAVPAQPALDLAEPAEAIEEADDAIDLADAERAESVAPASFRFTPQVPLTGPAMAPAAAPAPALAATQSAAAEPAAEERPLTLFERMMGVSRTRRAPEPPASLAPAPEPTAGTDDDVPGFLKRQGNR
jgi:cell division protein FtsZ